MRKRYGPPGRATRLERLLRRARNEIKAERNALVDSHRHWIGPAQQEARATTVKRLSGDPTESSSYRAIARWDRLLAQIEKELSDG